MMEPISGPVVTTRLGTIFSDDSEDTFSKYGLDFAGPGGNDGVAKEAEVKRERSVS